jgi:hypothetical protein
MKKIYFLLTFLLFICSLCPATMMPVNTATTWTAGTSGLNAFYGPGYSTANGYAELTVSNDFDKAAGKRAIIWATSIPNAGMYTYSLDTKYNDYYEQYDYWMVYLLNDGSQFNLVGGPLRAYTPVGGLGINTGLAAIGNADGQWHNYASSFSITAQQAVNYDYVAFVMVGSKKSDMVLAFDNFTTSVPEPCTVIIFGLGSVCLLRLRKK